jgi:dipeptidyl aminopeptidase/acylaminoacyl peptidase
VEDGRVVKLADEKMRNVSFPTSDTLGLGADQSTYEYERPWNPTYNDFYLVDLKTGERKAVEKETRWRYQWSGTGRYLLQYAQPDWWVYDVNSGEKRNLTEDLEAEFWNTDDDHPAPKNSWGMAGWTKDDEGVMLYDKYDIWYFPISKPGDAVNLTHGIGRETDSTFRYVSMDTEEEFIDTTRPLILSYVNNRNRSSGIYELRFGNRPSQLVVKDNSISSPRKAKNADVYLYSMSTFDEYGDLYVSDSTFKESRRLTDANPDNNGLLWGKTSLIEFTNLDGVKLQALLTLPEDYQEGKKYPMIVYVYEKLTRGLHQYSIPSTGSGFPVPFFSSNGYVVLRPDIIYTDGFPGPSAVKCIVPAIQKVVDMGIADPEHVGMTGHSWGGYQTAYIITQTDVFACAYAGAPVSNMTSAYGGIRWGTGNPRTFQYETGQSRIGGSLWEYPERYVENSPIFFADRVNTPLMMLHGDEDTAVPWYQSIEYFLALRRLDKPVWFLQYNEEPHGLRGDANKKDFTIRRMQFFDHYLKDAPMPYWMKQKSDFEYRNRPPVAEAPPKK